jgi:hypothetical protein
MMGTAATSQRKGMKLVLTSGETSGGNGNDAKDPRDAEFEKF